MRRLALALGVPAALVVSCSAPHGSSDGTRAPESARGGGSVSAPGLKISISADRESVAPGQSLRITIVVTNGPTARSLRFATGCQTDYEFVAADGKVAGSSGQMCAQSVRQRQLEPNESFTDEHVWTRGALEPNQPPAGKFQLRAVLLAVGDTVRSEPVRLVLP